MSTSARRASTSSTLSTRRPDAGEIHAITEKVLAIVPGEELVCARKNLSDLEFPDTKVSSMPESSREN